MENGILNINKNLLYKSQTNYKFGEPKTKASNQQIVLDNDTLRLLKDWKEIQQKVISSDSFILSYNSYPTQKHTLSHTVKRYTKMAIAHSIHIHDLRHSHASLLIQLGENPLVIRDQLGHEEIETTLGTYGHLYPNTNYEVANKLNGIINIDNNYNTNSLNLNQFTMKFPSNVQWEIKKSIIALYIKAFKLSTYYSHSIVAGGLDVMS